MNSHWILNQRCLALACLLVAIGCHKPAQEPAKDASPGKSATPASPAASADMEVGAAMLRILNVAHRSGGIMLRGECGLLGVTESYRMKTPVIFEPLDKALQEVSARYQNIYWRESPASGGRGAENRRAHRRTPITL